MQTHTSKVMINPLVMIVAAAFLLNSANAIFAQGSSFVAYSAAGADATVIQPVVNAFRNAVGSPNNGNAPGPILSGRREINWDGGGSATSPAPTPFTGFQLNRGALFTTPGTGFVQAPPSGLATTFNNVTYGTFLTFSPLRLFSSVGSNVTDAHFFRPGTDIPATVSAFGAVFSDVDLPESTSVEYFGPEGESLGKLFVPPANNGLSFVGLVFTNERIALVRITSGNTAPGPNESTVVDVVVMDDFIYGEPLVGPPTDADQCKKGGWSEFDFPRSFKNQGNCIQFVKTGK
jgi:hypothetical protein